MDNKNESQAVDDGRVIGSSYEHCPNCDKKRGRLQKVTENVLGWTMYKYRCDYCTSKFSTEKMPETFRTVSINDVREGRVETVKHK